MHNIMNVLPPEWMCGDEGTFANETVVRRLPGIVQRVIDNNEHLSDKSVDDLHKLIEEEKNCWTSKISMVDSSINEYVQKYNGSIWAEVPWLFGEVYMYHRIMNIVGNSVDPFLKSKRGLIDEVSNGHMLESFNDKRFSYSLSECFSFLVKQSLWGNQSDLSMFSSKSEVPTERSILIDETHVVLDFIEKKKDMIIHFVLDNFGTELVADLLLAWFLLDNRIARKIVFHAKCIPFFVSDTTEKDIHEMLAYLDNRNAEGSTLSLRMKEYIAKESVVIRSDNVWVLPVEFREVKDEITNALGECDLLILKGDLNYRRLVGDRQWDPSTKFSEVVKYMNIPLMAIRTLKSEVAVGIENWEEFESKKWMTSGEFGVIQCLT